MNWKRCNLGNTDIEVTELCCGTLTLGSLQANLTPEEGAKAIRRALECGVNFIDTAKTYRTYEHIRRGIDGFEDVVIASKSHSRTAPEVRADLEACLRELGRETIDIFHLHLVRSEEDLLAREDTLDMLVRAKEEGLVRGVGISTHGVAGTRAALGRPEIDVVFPIMNRRGLGITDGTRDEMIEVVRHLKAEGKGLYAMKPLGGGHLIDDIPGAIASVREMGLFDSIAVGMKTPEEVDVMAGVFAHDPAAEERALAMGRERAGKKHLIVYDFICGHCGACVDACVQGAITLGEKTPVFDTGKCILCGYCAAACPKFAIRVI